MTRFKDKFSYWTRTCTFLTKLLVLVGIYEYIDRVPKFEDEAKQFFKVNAQFRFNMGGG